MSELATEPRVSDEFVRHADPYRRELLAHCYRMLGSIHDAEDQVQETLIRAWRSYGDFEGRASMRTWLHRIATNNCIRVLETRDRRPLPSGLGGPGDDPDGTVMVSRPEVAWLQPLPDAAVLASADDPASVVGSRASMRLALIAALQHLPPRQRAVLILRDVLGWHATEVADLLGISTAAANSVLQRARAQLARLAPDEDDIREPDDPDLRGLLDRYAAAFETADVGSLTELLLEDATMEMPPQPTWYAGREMIGRFLASRVLVRAGDFRLVPVAANFQPGFAAYWRTDDGPHRAHAIMVLGMRDGRVSRIVSFNDDTLFPAFGLPPVYPGTAGSSAADEA
ncbi:MAG: sigma-70 family RNA polymerase sigma factor [Streptosporangiaceae bacterium]